MKSKILLLLLALLSTGLFAQQKEEAEKLIDEGIVLHDKGSYAQAISKYDKALELDKDNLSALTEKAYSLVSFGNYEEAIKCCDKAYKTHPGEKELNLVYTIEGNAFDAMNKPEKSIKIYDEGIKQFPDYHLLYFNKGVTLINLRKTEEAIKFFQQAVTLNPAHAGSHNAMARLLNLQKQNIPSILAYCRFLVIETGTPRAKENLASLKKLINGNAEKTGDKSVTISLSPEMLDNVGKKGKNKENNFSTTDMILSMSSALNFEKENQDKPEVKRFIAKLETVCASLDETRKGNFGFYWAYYAPYFIEMKKQNLVETFGYIAFASSDDEEVAAWLKANQTATDKFYEWSKGFAWKGK